MLPPSLSLPLSLLPPNRHHPSIGFINTVCGIVVIAVQMLGFNRMQKRVGKHATASIGLLLFGVGNALVPIFPMVLVGLTPGAGAFNATTDGVGNSSSNSNGMSAGGNSSALGGGAVISGGGASYAARVGAIVGCLIALIIASCGFALSSPSISSILSRYSSTKSQGSVLGVAEALQAMSRVIGA